MFQIKGIDHVVIRARGLGPMLEFYIDVLGCALERQNEEIGLYQLRAGASLIDLVPVDGVLGRAGGAGPGAEGRNVDHVCLRVEPFDGDGLIEWLESRGASPGKVESRYGADGPGPSLYLADPEGNVIELKGPPWKPQSG